MMRYDVCKLNASECGIISVPDSLACSGRILELLLVTISHLALWHGFR